MPRWAVILIIVIVIVLVIMPNPTGTGTFIGNAIDAIISFLSSIAKGFKIG
jgi:hypothetical protein